MTPRMDLMTAISILVEDGMTCEWPGGFGIFHANTREWLHYRVHEEGAPAWTRDPHNALCFLVDSCARSVIAQFPAFFGGCDIRRMAAEPEFVPAEPPAAIAAKEDAAAVHLDPGLPDEFTGDPIFDELLVECRRVLGVKGRDYTIGSVDRLANFRVAAEAFGIEPGVVLGIYLYKHVAAVFNYIKTGGQSESEPIKGRIVDVINYMLLFYRMIQEKERPK